MKRKIVSELMLTLLVISMLTLAFNSYVVRASGTIYIRADGSVEGTTDISTVDNITYTFTANIYDSIVVERDNIVVDGAGYTLQGTGSGRGIDLTERNNVTIKNMEIKLFSVGIGLAGSSYNKIFGNTVTNIKYIGIKLYADNTNMYLSTSYNNISDNNIIETTEGIFFDYLLVDFLGSSSKSGYNDEFENGCNHNTITRNNIINNSAGIVTTNAPFETNYNNSFYHNNFIQNRIHCFLSPHGGPNRWDDGYPSGGNYWSDYIAEGGYDTDGDGIGDIPYVIDENNQDNYPLMNPWSPKPASPVEATHELIGTIKDWTFSKGLENSLTAKLDNAIHQLNKGNDRAAPHKLTAFINQVEALRGKKLTPEQADHLIAEAQRIIDLING